MRTRISLALFAVFATTIMIGWIASPTPLATAVQGGWVITSEDDSHQRGLYIFAESNYSIMFVSGGEPRANVSNPQTDAETLAAYGSFVANSGRYTLEGDQITTEPYMAKNPNLMAGWPDNDRTSTVTVDGDMMTWTGANGSTTTLRKVGN